MVYHDSSGFSLGCVSMQQGFFIAYSWRNINVNEQNYHTHDLELVALVFTLKIWKDHVRISLWYLHKSPKSSVYFKSKEPLFEVA